MASGSNVPEWKLDAVYGGYDSEEYRRDRADLVKAAGALSRKLNDTASKKKSPEKWLTFLLKKII